jgi:transcriptional regulator with XRE-family HTH domain
MTFDEFIEEEKERDPEFRREWEASEPAFQIIQALVGARSRHKWTQAELARRMGTTQAQVSRAESTGEVSPEFLARFAAALGGETHLSIKLPGTTRLTVKLDLEPARSPSAKRQRHRLIFSGVASPPIRSGPTRSQPDPAAPKVPQAASAVRGRRTTTATLVES